MGTGFWLRRVSAASDGFSPMEQECAAPRPASSRAGDMDPSRFLRDRRRAGTCGARHGAALGRPASRGAALPPRGGRHRHAHARPPGPRGPGPPTSALRRRRRRGPAGGEFASDESDHLGAPPPWARRWWCWCRAAMDLPRTSTAASGGWRYAPARRRSHEGWCGTPPTSTSPVALVHHPRTARTEHRPRREAPAWASDPTRENDRHAARHRRRGARHPPRPRPADAGQRPLDRGRRDDELRTSARRSPPPPTTDRLPGTQPPTRRLRAPPHVTGFTSW